MFIPVEDLVLQSGPVWHGTALGWKKAIDTHITKLPITSNRFCGVKFVDTLSKVSILAYTTYLPTSGKDEEFLDVLSQLSFHISENNIENSIIIIGADSNVSKKSSKRGYEAMLNLLELNSLKSVLLTDEATFHHNNQTSESQVDHIYFYIPKNSNIKVAFKEQAWLKKNPSNVSSHDVIVGEVVLPVVEESQSSEDYSETYTEFVVKKPKWEDSSKEEYKIETAKELKNLIDNYNDDEFIPTLCEMFSRTMVISAEKNIKITEHKMNKTEKRYPYFSKEYREANINHKKVFNEWRKAGRPNDTNHPKKEAVLSSRRKMRMIARNEEIVKSIEQNDDLMCTFKNNPSDIYDKMKKARGEYKKAVEIPFIETLAGTYTGDNILEGFAANTEIMCNENQNDDKFDNEIYRIFKRDNMTLIDITTNEDVI